MSQRPRDLTRQAPKEVKLALDEAGFTEAHLRSGLARDTNQDIAASIIGFIRHAAPASRSCRTMSGSTGRVKTILASRPWTAAAAKVARADRQATGGRDVVDRAALDRGQFQAEGGFSRINKVFDGELEAGPRSTSTRRSGGPPPD